MDEIGIIKHSMNPQFRDAHEVILTTISLLSRYTNEISIILWGWYQDMINILNHYVQTEPTYYIIDHLVVSFSNFIQKGSDTFVNTKMQNDQTPIQILLEATSNIINKGNSKNDSQLSNRGFNLIICLLENLEGKIDNYLEPLVQVTVDQLQRN